MISTVERQRVDPSEVQGLRVWGFLNVDEQKDLFWWVSGYPQGRFVTTQRGGQRWVQDHGGRYRHREATVYREDIKPLPRTLQKLAERIQQESPNVWLRTPDHVIVNRYRKGEGIGMHVDALCFGPTVTSISLVQPVRLEFVHPSGLSCEIALFPGDALEMTGSARNEWQHGISRNWGDSHRNPLRVSLQFRTLENPYL